VTETTTTITLYTSIASYVYNIKKKTDNNRNTKISKQQIGKQNSEARNLEKKNNNN